MYKVHNTTEYILHSIVLTIEYTITDPDYKRLSRPASLLSPPDSGLDGAELLESCQSSAWRLENGAMNVLLTWR